MYILKIRFKRNDSLCASYVLYIIYLIKIIGIDFKSADLYLYYQTISWKKMTLRKLNRDTSVKHIVQMEKTQERSSKRNISKKKIHFLVDKTKNFHKRKENINTNIIGEWFRQIKWTTNCYFSLQN